jgi:8-oxo-dGTP pyrophosphatase MutT (NUDIX family)
LEGEMPCRFAGRSVDKDGPSARRLAAKELEEEAGLDILKDKVSKRKR